MPAERHHHPIESDSADRWHTYELVSGVPDIREVRRWVRTVLANLTEGDLLDVLLVISELASNVFDHAAFPARLKVRKSEDPCVVGIVAEDASPALPQLRTGSPGSTRGRGLVMVNRLAQQWGFARREAGKSVWAVLPCATVT
ncbi:ATP-binding protein [Lentzea sp.]|uniref:ATP-binding protein n=1 Tax=Lentzea sp. TaxID=56099 RepID=UPI002ED193AC